MHLISKITNKYKALNKVHNKKTQCTALHLCTNQYKTGNKECTTYALFKTLTINNL